MNRCYKSLLALALGLVSIAGCTDEMPAPDTALEQITLSFKSSGAQTKTELVGENKVHWKTTDLLRVFEVSENSFSTAKSSDVEIEEDLIVFGASFDAIGTEVPVSYYAVYPEDKWVDTSKDIAKIRMTTPEEQFPSATSFDGAADLLISNSADFGSQGEAKESFIDVGFKRVVAVAKMTLSGLTTTEPVLSVKFSAKDQKLAGNSEFDLTTGEAVKYAYMNAKSTIECLYPSKDFYLNSGTNVVYFTALPAELTAGNTFTVEVSTETTRYTRTVTLPEGRTLAFKPGVMSKFSVDMTSAKQESLVVEDSLLGTYVVLNNKNGEYYAMTNGGTNNKPGVVFNGYSGTESSVSVDDESLLWEISEEDGLYVMKDCNGKYLFNNTNSNYAKLESDRHFVTISKKDDGTYTIQSEVSGRSLQQNKNTGSDMFAFYTDGGQSGSVLLVKGIKIELPQLDAPASLSATVDTDVPNKINVSWEAVTDAVSYTVTCGDETATIAAPTTTASFDGLEYSTLYNVAVVATADGFEPSEAVSTTCTTGERPASSGVEVEKTSFSSTSDALDDVISYATAKGGGTANPTISSNEIRLYQGSPGGNITITAKAGYKITSVEIGSSMKTQVKYQVDGGAHQPDKAASIVAKGKYAVDSISASSVTFHCYGTTASTRLYVNYLRVVYTTE